MNLFQMGQFKLASGKESSWKIECDALAESDWRCLAAMAVEVVPPFGQVVGVPIGGIPFADALRPLCSPLATAILVVGDVLTTGGSLLQTVKLAREAAPRVMPLVRPDIVGLVAFARGNLPKNPELSACHALFTLPKELWVEPPIRCAVCKAWSDETMLLTPMMYRTADGFHFRWFTCQTARTSKPNPCPPTYHCPECNKKHLGCAFCGCGEEYT